MKSLVISGKLERGEELTESEICYFLSCMGKLVLEEEGERHRWTQDVHTVTMWNGKLYAVDWGRGLTENNENEFLNQPYEIPESDIPKPALCLYLLSQKENVDYDTYDSCVVCAESEHEAKRTYPDEYCVWNEKAGEWAWRNPIDPDAKCRVTNWATRLENIHCKLIGTAADGIEKGVVIASFNAG